MRIKPDLASGLLSTISMELKARRRVDIPGLHGPFRPIAGGSPAYVPMPR